MIRSVLQPLLLVLLCSTLLSLEAQEWLEVQKVLPPNDASSPIGGQSDRLGWSVAVDGDILVAGAPESDVNGSGSGAAFVYEKIGGEWTFVAQIIADDGSVEADFGWSLDISGLRMAIGAPGDNPGNMVAAGSVYIFERLGGNWTQTAKIISDSPTSSDRFGYSVSLAGDRVLIGTPEDDDSGNGSGSAYIFEYSNGSWTQGTKLVASDGASGDNLGLSVSLSDSVAVCGAYLQEAGGTNRGAVYVYELDNGDWTQSQKLTAPDGGDGDRLGASVSVHGNFIASGAIEDDDGGVNAGAVYLFELNNGLWSFNTKLVANDAAANDLFGKSACLDGTSLVVGAFQDDDQGPNSGSSYVYTFNGSWSLQEKISSMDGAADDFFAYSVSISGNSLVCGSRGDDESGNDSGSISIFKRSGSVWSFSLKGVANDMIDDPSLDQFGFDVAISGDNAIVGAYLDDDLGIASGSVRFYHFNGGQWLDEGKIYSSDLVQQDFFGFKVAMSGNTALVSAYGDGDMGSFSGSVYVFERIGGQWMEVQKLLASDGAAFDNFGFSLAIDGDKAVIGAHLDDDFGAFSGSAYVFERIGGVWTETQKLLPLSGAAQDQFGNVVDLDGDMIIIGARNESSSVPLGGAAYLFENVSGTWMQMAILKPNDQTADKFFGSAVSLSQGTILVGAAGDNSGGLSSGAAYVFEYNGLNWTQVVKLQSDLPGDSEYFGSALDNEGRRLAIGSYRAKSTGNVATGAVFIIDGTSGVWLQTDKLEDQSGGLSDYFGGSLDMDGDRLLIGAPLDDDNGVNSGSAFFFVYCSGEEGGLGDPQCNSCNLDNITTDMSVVEIGFGTASARVNAIWNNPNGTNDCEVRGGRIDQGTIGTGNLKFANINNTLIISQTNGSTVLFNVVLFNNPNVPFIVGKTYGFEVRCLCQDESAYTNWSGIIPEATFVVPVPPAIQQGSESKTDIQSVKAITLFPNPSDGLHLTILIEEGLLKGYQARILDVNGRLVGEKTVGDDSKSGKIIITFDHQLSKGLYVLEIRGRDRLLFERFLVE
jgi:hypothetical protein